MARSVSLSDEAFLALREEKREGESDSDVVLRLRREARAKRKDPTKFFKGRTRFVLSLEELDRLREASRLADLEKLAHLDRLRRGEG